MLRAQFFAFHWRHLIQEDSQPRIRIEILSLMLCTAALIISLCWFVKGTIAWPLTGDASLMHYICFLIAKGFLPYKEVLDFNLPGSYLPTWAMTSLVFQCDLAWRLYDFGLVVLATLGMYVIARPYSRFAAFWAGSILALVHGRDGLEQAGERDFCAAAFLIAGTAFLIWAKRKSKTWPAMLFGAFAGFAFTIKPTLFLFVLIPLLDQYPVSSNDRGAKQRTFLALVGSLVPIFGSAVWLGYYKCLRAFFYCLSVLGTLHASLGHVSWSVLVHNSIAPVLPLVVLWIATLLVTNFPLRQRQTGADKSVRLLLIIGAVAGLFSYLVQKRGYPYHRYPFLAFLLLLMGLDFANLLRAKDTRRYLSAAAFLWSSFFLAFSSVSKAVRYQEVEEPVTKQIKTDLDQLASSRHLTSLQRNVQCLDTVSGCLEALDRMQMVQTTGQLYDELLFHSADNRAVSDSRRSFAQQLERKAPAVFIITSTLFPSGPGGYAKLDSWPEFKAWLDRNYLMAVERSPIEARRSMGRPVVPVGYRLYVRRPDCM